MAPNPRCIVDPILAVSTGMSVRGWAGCFARETILYDCQLSPRFLTIKKAIVLERSYGLPSTTTTQPPEPRALVGNVNQRELAPPDLASADLASPIPPAIAASTASGVILAMPSPPAAASGGEAIGMICRLCSNTGVVPNSA